MTGKTEIQAQDNKNDILVTRDFELPVHLLFKAFVDPEIVAQWMGTKVIQLEPRNSGAWSFETSGPDGQVLVKMHGVFHEISPDKKITRTFEMENPDFQPQLEFLEFDSTSENTSRLNMHIIFRNQELRDQQLRMPFAFGLNLAHNRLQEIVSQLK